jgi:flavin-dependent dehydrogenase
VNDFDLIVVGAGPGGSNAASVALDAGLRVAQIDSARFPRVKPCAGGVTLKAAGALRYALDPSVCRSFDAIEFNLWGKRRNRFTHRCRFTPSAGPNSTTALSARISRGPVSLSWRTGG